MASPQVICFIGLEASAEVVDDGSSHDPRRQYHVMQISRTANEGASFSSMVLDFPGLHSAAEVEKIKAQVRMEADPCQRLTVVWLTWYAW
jgi:hypothetical protein